MDGGYTVACLNYTLQTMMPLPGWPVMAPKCIRQQQPLTKYTADVKDIICRDILDIPCWTNDFVATGIDTSVALTLVGVPTVPCDSALRPFLSSIVITPPGAPSTPQTQVSLQHILWYYNNNNYNNDNTATFKRIYSKDADQATTMTTDCESTSMSLQPLKALFRFRSIFFV